MRRAAISGRLDRLRELIEEVARHDAALADGLKQLASRFDYEQLIEILEGDQESRGS
ncbi:MAG: hypothetical protein GY722_20170 [bacterium]|nr:hypothetical protein [bacterium]